MPAGIDFEIRTKFHPEKPTQEEIEYMKDLDPTFAGILSHKILTIASEGNETLLKLGASSGCRWGDTALAIYTNSGDNAVCATGLYFHTVLGCNRVMPSSAMILFTLACMLRIWVCLFQFFAKISLSVLLEPLSTAANAGPVNQEVYQARQEVSMMKDYRLPL